MSNAKLLLVSTLMGAALVAPAGLGSRWSSSADGTLSAFETTASPISDPDPRDDTAIAVSRKNDQLIAGASRVVQGVSASAQGNSLVAYYFSSDGGHTWGNGVLQLETPQKTWGRASDPSLASDLDGNFYLCALMLDNSSFDTGVYVFKSIDGGRTFKDPLPVIVDIGNLSNPTRASKPRLTADISPSSPFKNSVYVVWTSTSKDDTGQNGTITRFARLRPGDGSFSAPRTISHRGDMRAPSVTTGPNGEFYAAWVGMPARSLLFNASTDGGDTFLPGLSSIDMTVHDYIGSLEGPNAPFHLDGLERQNSFPTIDVDRSAGPYRGRVYVAWAETVNGKDTDIFLRRITPAPNTLPAVSPPVKVNNDPGGADQFFPSLSVDSSTGSVEVAFYDRRNNIGTVLMNLYLARSTDGGLSFGENTRISSSSSDPRIQADVAPKNSPAIGMGDYVALAAVDGKADLLWTDTRRGKQEIFYAQIGFSATSPPPNDAPPNDSCQTPRAITSLPYEDILDTSTATSSPDDPISCTGAGNTNTVWYTITPNVNGVFAVDTRSSGYDTVVSVLTGVCSSLAQAACDDDFTASSNETDRSLLTFQATAGVTYLIEVAGKGSGGSSRIRVGFPTIIEVQYAVDDSGVNPDTLILRGAGFARNSVVAVQRPGEDFVVLATTAVELQGDGTATLLTATKKKLKKLVKPRKTVTIKVVPADGIGTESGTFLFRR